MHFPRAPFPSRSLGHLQHVFLTFLHPRCLRIEGCTLLAARRMLFGLGASKVSAYVTHAAFSSTSGTPARLLQPELHDGRHAASASGHVHLGAPSGEGAEVKRTVVKYATM